MSQWAFLLKASNSWNLCFQKVQHVCCQLSTSWPNHNISPRFPQKSQTSLTKPLRWGRMRSLQFGSSWQGCYLVGWTVSRLAVNMRWLSPHMADGNLRNPGETPPSNVSPQAPRGKYDLIHRLLRDTHGYNHPLTRGHGGGTLRFQ